MEPCRGEWGGGGGQFFFETNARISVHMIGAVSARAPLCLLFLPVFHRVIDGAGCRAPDNSQS